MTKKKKEYNITLRCGDLEIYVTADGEITSALSYLPAFDEWIDVMDRVLNDKNLLAQIDYDLSEQLEAEEREAC